MMNLCRFGFHSLVFVDKSRFTRPQPLHGHQMPRVFERLLVCEKCPYEEWRAVKVVFRLPDPE